MKSNTAAHVVGGNAGQPTAEGQPLSPEMDTHQSCMTVVLHLASANPRSPFAALLVDRFSGETIAAGLNRTQKHPLRHGEIDCIESAIELHGDVDWSRLRMYSTAEPCCMCLSAIMWCGISEVVYGTSISTLRELGWDQFDCDAAAVERAASFGRCRLIGGIEEHDCDALFASAAGLRFGLKPH